MKSDSNGSKYFCLSCLMIRDLPQYDLCNTLLWHLSCFAVLYLDLIAWHIKASKYAEVILNPKECSLLNVFGASAYPNRPFPLQSHCGDWCYDSSNQIVLHSVAIGATQSGKICSQADWYCMWIVLLTSDCCSVNRAICIGFLSFRYLVFMSS